MQVKDCNKLVFPLETPIGLLYQHNLFLSDYNVMYKQVQIKIRNISVNQPHSFSHIVVGWGFLSA